MSEILWRAALAAVSVAILLAEAAIPGAKADEGRRHSLVPAYREECGACHVAYPPRFLPARAWQAVMAGLERHFGTDASLDGPRAREIGAYLAANAGSEERSDANVNLRISETRWFRREHRNDHDGLTAALWKSPAVKSAANCGACHRKAAEGDFGEGGIRLPRLQGASHEH